MAKLKLTKNELKAQKDALKMFQRYLPTLTLKKQQLQSEIRTIDEKCKAVRAEKKALEEDFEKWISVFGEREVFKPEMVTVRNIKRGWSNIAGVKIPVYEGADFGRGDYDLYSTPLWIDMAADRMERELELDLEAEVLEEQVRLLTQELRTTSQRVNLFEKVKIPETKANIKKIGIFLGDEQVAAVVRSKISKKKLQSAVDAANENAAVQEASRTRTVRTKKEAKK
ncbi:MAG: V-type ATP synthase subunit D [Treponema sp.]|nr:V-type ATP synthase subunit D [Treponema sp.]